MTCTRYRSRRAKTPTDSQTDMRDFIRSQTSVELKRSQYKYNCRISEQKIGSSNTEVFFRLNARWGALISYIGTIRFLVWVCIYLFIFQIRSAWNMMPCSFIISYTVTNVSGENAPLQTM